MHPDNKYIQALIENDTVVLNEMYSKYADKIKWMILKNNGTEQDAADIFQEALLSIYDKAVRNEFQLTCPLEAFLFLICKNKWINELNRRKNSRVTITDTGGFIIADDVKKQAEDCLLQEQRMELLEEKIKEMNEGCKELLRLSWSGKPLEEVAQILKVSYGYVRKKKSECVAALMKLMKQSPQFNILKWNL